MELLFFLMTNDLQLAREAEQAGVERIGPDLEILGKEARQGYLEGIGISNFREEPPHPPLSKGEQGGVFNVRISRHTVEDVGRIRSVLEKYEVFVRINPIHSGSEEEIERVLEGGAQVIMLPMFRTVAEASHFVTMIQGRAKPVLLLETPEAMMRIDEFVAVEGIHEVHFGLNDLCLGLNLLSFPRV